MNKTCAAVICLVMVLPSLFASEGKKPSPGRCLLLRMIAEEYNARHADGFFGSYNPVNLGEIQEEPLEQMRINNPKTFRRKLEEAGFFEDSYDDVRKRFFEVFEGEQEKDRSRSYLLCGLLFWCQRSSQSVDTFESFDGTIRNYHPAVFVLDQLSRYAQSKSRDDGNAKL